MCWSKNLANITYKASHYQMNFVECNDIMGWYNRSDLFMGFSFDKEGTNYRGYCSYEIVTRKTELSGIYLTMDYYHQNWKTSYPAQTAWDYAKNNSSIAFYDEWNVFSKIRIQVNYYPWDENGKLNIEEE